MSPLRWTLKSTRTLAAELTRMGHKVGANLVGGPFVVRLVLAPRFSDQWWEVGKDRAWLVNADGTRRATDFSEVYDGLRDFVRTAKEVDSTSDLLRLMRSLATRGDARVNFAPAGNAFHLLERLSDVR